MLYIAITKVKGKKDGQQKYRVRVSYKDKEGNYKQVERTAYGLAEAKSLELSLTAENKSNASVAKITVQELADEFLATKKYELRESSYAKIERTIKKYVIPYFKNTRVNNLTTPLLQRWKAYVEEQGLSIGYKKNLYSDFRTMLYYAVKMDYIIKNPLCAVGNFQDPYDIVGQEDKIQYYTADEFKKYISCAKASAVTLADWGYYIFFNIAFYTGMRKGEINALKWSDIEDNKIHVRRNIVQGLDNADRETPPKNKSSYRTLIMPEPLINLLSEHKERQMSVGNFSEELRICGGTRCLRNSSISVKNKQFAKAAGLKQIRIHDFRHSHASLLANEGINIQEIARRLGHSKVDITWNTYAHLYPQEEERAIAILNKIT